MEAATDSDGKSVNASFRCKTGSCGAPRGRLCWQPTSVPARRIKRCLNRVPRRRKSPRRLRRRNRSHPGWAAAGDTRWTSPRKEGVPSRLGARAGHSFGAAPRPSQREPRALRGRHRRRRRRGPRPAAAAESLRLRRAPRHVRPYARDAPRRRATRGRRCGAPRPSSGGSSARAATRSRTYNGGPGPASRSTRTIRRASRDW